MTLGQNLQAARKAKGLSQETLAEQIGVSRQALGKWEKDIALPGLDNLQAAAQVLGVSVDTLLGTETAGPAPAVTLDAMRDLLAARDAEQRKHRRLWGLLGAAAVVVVVLLLVVQNLAYQRKMQSLTDSYAMLQSQLSSTTADLSTRMDELQDAVRQGKSTVLEWHWVPVDKLHRDVQSSWMPVLVQVTPSESTTGMTARLSVTYGDTTELHDMDVLAGDIYQAQLVFTVGQTYDLTIQWTAADGAAANEWIWRGCVVWDKMTSRPQKGRFRQQSEYVVWGSNGPMPISRPVGCLPGVFRYANPQNRTHVTEKPLQLMRDLVKICVPGGRILDPFCGAGTTVLAAKLEGYEAVGIEVTDAYYKLGVDRVRMALEAHQETEEPD